MTARLWQATVGIANDVLVWGPFANTRLYRRVESGASIDAFQATDLVPLVTLTEDDAETILDGARALGWTSSALGHLRAQLAQPRMDEPTEFGAMVEATINDESDPSLFVRCMDETYLGKVWSARSGCRFAWSELVDPRPIGGDS